MFQMVCGERWCKDQEQTSTFKHFNVYLLNLNSYAYSTFGPLLQCWASFCRHQVLFVSLPGNCSQVAQGSCPSWSLCNPLRTHHRLFFLWPWQLLLPLDMILNICKCSCFTALRFPPRGTKQTPSFLQNKKEEKEKGKERPLSLRLFLFLSGFNALVGSTKFTFLSSTI